MSKYVVVEERTIPSGTYTTYHGKYVTFEKALCVASHANRLEELYRNGYAKSKYRVMEVPEDE